MKKTILFATVVAMALAIAVPTQAQSLKDKREAKKENWQREQRQSAEEDELRHQMRMDSLANAKRIADEKAEKAEAERRNREAEERARQKKAEEEAGLQEVEHVEPCSEIDFPSTEDIIRGHGIGIDRNQQFSIEKARVYAVNDLASQISSKVESLTRIQGQSWDQNEMNNYAGTVNQEIQMAVKQTTGFAVACRKTMTYTQNGVRMMKTYMVVEISAERVLKAAYDALQKNDQTRIDESFEQFHKDFKEHFNEL